MQIITTAVIKGGTGKTTTAAALAQAAVQDGKRVLAIDLDPQANLTFAIGADPNVAGAYQLINGAPAAELIQSTAQGIDTIAASPDLTAEKTTPGSGKRLHRALMPIKENYDLIMIDTPPQMTELTFNAMLAATGLIIPLTADNFSLQGLYQIVDIAHQMQRSNPELAIIGTVITNYNRRTNFNKFMRNTIKEKSIEVGAPYLIEIRAGIAIPEAAAMQQSIFDYAPRSNPAQDYMQLYNMILEG